jgi:hypothetical protein
VSRIIATKWKKALEFTKCFMSVMSSKPHKYPAGFFLDFEISLKGFVEEHTLLHTQLRQMVLLYLGRKLMLCLEIRLQVRKSGATFLANQISQVKPGQHREMLQVDQPHVCHRVETISNLQRLNLQS